MFFNKSVFMIVLLAFCFVVTIPCFAQDAEEAEEAKTEPIKLPKQLSEIKVIHQEPAPYPPLAKQHYAEAKVFLDATIGEDGMIKEVIVSNSNVTINESLKAEVEEFNKKNMKPGEQPKEETRVFTKEIIQLQIKEAFEKSALDTSKKWKFEPVTSSGKPVSIQIPLEIEFKLNTKVGSPEEGKTEQK